jgi:hypothetical protein
MPKPDWVVRYRARRGQQWQEIYRSAYEGAARTAFDLHRAKLAPGGLIRLFHGCRIVTSADCTAEPYSTEGVE